MAKEEQEKAAREIKNAHKTKGSKPHVPGPSPNPATNMLISDIIMRASSYMIRGALHKTLLKQRYSEHAAKQIVKQRSIPKRLATVALAKMATKSVPGALIVGSGILAKTVYDRSFKTHEARQRGDRKLAETAKD